MAGGFQLEARNNAVIAKYALLAKPRGGGQSAPQNGTAEAQ